MYRVLYKTTVKFLKGEIKKIREQKKDELLDKLFKYMKKKEKEYTV